MGWQLGKLLVCLALDFAGSATTIFTVATAGAGAAAETADLVKAPPFAMILKMIYGSEFIALFGLFEEIAPGTDLFPTATVAWTVQTFCPDGCLARWLKMRSPASRARKKQ